MCLIMLYCLRDAHKLDASVVPDTVSQNINYP